MAESDESLKLKNQLCFPLYAAARQVVGLYTPHLKPLDLTYTQYLVFLALWEEDHQTVGALCDKLYLDSGTLTPLLKRLEAAGRIVRTRSAADERVVVVSLTEAGRALKQQAAEIPGAIAACVPLEPAEGHALYTLLYKLLAKEETPS